MCWGRPLLTGKEIDYRRIDARIVLIIGWIKALPIRCGRRAIEDECLTKAASKSSRRLGATSCKDVLQVRAVPDYISISAMLYVDR